MWPQNTCEFSKFLSLPILVLIGSQWTHINDIGSTTDLIEKILALKVTSSRKALFYCEKQVPTPQLSQAATGERKESRTWNLEIFRLTIRVTFERNKKKIQEGHVGTFIKIWSVLLSNIWFLWFLQSIFLLSYLYQWWCGFCWQSLCARSQYWATKVGHEGQKLKQECVT